MRFPPDSDQLLISPIARTLAVWRIEKHEPATLPPVWQELNNVFIPQLHEPNAWVISIKTDSSSGLTCGDVANALYERMYSLARRSDYESVDRRKQKDVAGYSIPIIAAFRRPDLEDGLRWLDFMGRVGLFGGLLEGEEMAQPLIGPMIVPSFLLRGENL